MLAQLSVAESVDLKHRELKRLQEQSGNFLRVRPGEYRQQQ